MITTVLTLFGLIMITIWIMNYQWRIQRRKRLFAMNKLGLERSHPMEPGRTYSLRLSDGHQLARVRVLGVTIAEHDTDEGLLPLPTFLILQKPDGTRAFVRPEVIRYFEELKDQDSE